MMINWSVTWKDTILIKLHQSSDQSQSYIYISQAYQSPVLTYQAMLRDSITHSVKKLAAWDVLCGRMELCDISCSGF